MTSPTAMEHACQELCDTSGSPLLALPHGWSGLPLGLFSIPGHADQGAHETAHPTVLVACSGSGERWYRSAGRTHHLRTAVGMIEIYPRGLEFDRMEWDGAAGHCIALQLLPDAMRSLVQDGDEIDLLRTHEVFDERLQWIGAALAQAAADGGRDRLYVEGLSMALLGRLEQRGSLVRNASRRRGRFGPAMRQRLHALIGESLGNDLSIARLAQEARMSPDHFSDCFKDTFGVSPHRYVLRERVAAAQRLLHHSALPIAQVAGEVGFATQSHFTQVFRQHTGVTPARWRQGLPSRLSDIPPENATDGPRAAG